MQRHDHRSTASMVPHLVLAELGVSYELVLVDRDHDAHKSTSYLKLHPNGLIPVWVDGDLVLYDTHPDAELAPTPGTPQRAHVIKRLMWLTNMLQARPARPSVPHTFRLDLRCLARPGGVDAWLPVARS